MGDRTTGPDGMADAASETRKELLGMNEHTEIIVVRWGDKNGYQT
jgi:hypothetical protein